MKKGNRKSANDMRPEYDFASMKGGVRGKYAKRHRAGTNLVLLDPELAEAFPTEAAVNDALRAVLKMTKTVRLPKEVSGQAGGAKRDALHLQIDRPPGPDGSRPSSPAARWRQLNS
jgi:hypothetical protein